MMAGSHPGRRAYGAQAKQFNWTRAQLTGRKKADPKAGPLLIRQARRASVWMFSVLVCIFVSQLSRNIDSHAFPFLSFIQQRLLGLSIK